MDLTVGLCWLTGRSTSNKIYHLQSTKYASIPIATPMKIVLVNIIIPINKCPGHRKPVGLSDIARIAHGPPRPSAESYPGFPTIATAKARSWDHRGKGIHVQPQRCPKSRQVEQPIMFLLMEQMFDVFVVVNGNYLEVFEWFLSFLLWKIHEDAVCFFLWKVLVWMV